MIINRSNTACVGQSIPGEYYYYLFILNKLVFLMKRIEWIEVTTQIKHVNLVHDYQQPYHPICESITFELLIMRPWKHQLSHASLIP